MKIILIYCCGTVLAYIILIGHLTKSSLLSHFVYNFASVIHSFIHHRSLIDMFLSKFSILIFNINIIKKENYQLLFDH